MGKERRSSLDSKWKLNKELKDYKQHKQNKKQGGTGYANEINLVKHRSKRKPSYCKKLKGPHDFVPQEIKKYSI